MKSLICIVFAFLVLIFSGCESKILITENPIRPASELDILKLGNPKDYGMQPFYKKYFRRAFVFYSNFERF